MRARVCVEGRRGQGVRPYSAQAFSGPDGDWTPPTPSFARLRDSRPWSSQTAQVIQGLR